MNKTEIEYVDESWNPVTGCLGPCGTVCRYCYAKGIVRRFQGYELKGQITTHNPLNKPTVLTEPLTTVSKHGVQRRAAFPFGFEPTFHKYRLDEPIRKKTPKTIFVVDMGDLFGDWVPDEWIEQVFETCKKAPQHRYMFLTKNPKRYDALFKSGKLLEGETIWYGSTCSKTTDLIYGNPALNNFVSIEPLLEPVGADGVFRNAHVKLAIIGVETGTQKGKVVPERRWIKNLVDDLHHDGIPVFMKNSVKPFWDGELITELPWR